MLPYLHVGHFDLPTFGLMLVLAAVCATALLFANLGRFKIDADAIGIIATATIAGMLGGKLWHALQDPAYLLAHPSVLVDRSGFAWFGGLLGGMLTILDLCAPSAALGYGIGASAVSLQETGTTALPVTCLGR